MLKGISKVMVWGVLAMVPKAAVFAAEDWLQFGTVGTAGSGCLPGTAQVKFKKDTEGNVRRIEFSAKKFQVLAGANSGKQLDRKVCTIAVPFDLPSGKTLVIDSVEVAGTQALDRDAKSEVKAEAFILASEESSESLIATKEFSGALQKKFYLEKGVSKVECQSAFSAGTLRANISVVNRSNGNQAKALTRLGMVTALNLKVLDCE